MTTLEATQNQAPSDNEGAWAAATKTTRSVSRVQSSIRQSKGFRNLEKEYRKLQEGLHMVLEERASSRLP